MLQELEDQEAAVMQKQYGKKSPVLKGKGANISNISNNTNNNSRTQAYQPKRTTHQAQF
jgi:hypothetical protein